MKVNIEIDEKELRRLVVCAIQEMVSFEDVKESDVQILVKTKSNYKAEWEPGEFRATYNRSAK